MRTVRATKRMLLHDPAQARGPRDEAVRKHRPTQPYRVGEKVAGGSSGCLDSCRARQDD